MELIYLGSLILGGFLLALSMFSGTEVDADFTSELDSDVSLTESGTISGEGLSSALQFLSFRNIVFFIAFFGLTGTILTKLGTTSIISFLFSTGMGSLAAALGHKTLDYLKNTESGHISNTQDMEGLSARVTVDIAARKKGKITFNNRDQSLQLIARIADESAKPSFRFGDRVTIIKIEKNIAFVAEADFVDTRGGGTHV